MLVETGCGRLFVDDRDSTLPGIPIVLWHSLLCDGGMWAGQLDALMGRARVINIDGPGHGRSASTTRPYTMDDSVDAALSVLDALKIERCHWVGLSWGGMVGMRLAIRAPSRIEKLVLCDTSADAEAKEKLPSYRAMTLVLRTLGPIPLLLDRVVPIFFSPSTQASRPDLIEGFRSRLGAMDRTSLRHAVDAVIFGRKDVRGELSRIRCPTLILVGEDDIATPPARSSEIAARIPGSRVVSIPRAGHLSVLEQPGAANATLLPFLGV